MTAARVTVGESWYLWISRSREAAQETASHDSVAEQVPSWRASSVQHVSLKCMTRGIVKATIVC